MYFHFLRCSTTSFFQNQVFDNQNRVARKFSRSKYCSYCTNDMIVILEQKWFSSRLQFSGKTWIFVGSLRDYAVVRTVHILHLLLGFPARSSDQRSTSLGRLHLQEKLIR